ncbi:hypothetical protein SFR_2416 [Streptomyces sp. FR-008]|nr:hypothetical protein SFR_2416 [Streptomyces sp. FR-008]
MYEAGAHRRRRPAPFPHSPPHFPAPHPIRPIPHAHTEIPRSRTRHGEAPHPLHERRQRPSGPRSVERTASPRKSGQPQTAPSRRATRHTRLPLAPPPHAIQPRRRSRLRRLTRPAPEQRAAQETTTGLRSRQQACGARYGGSGPALVLPARGGAITGPEFRSLREWPCPAVAVVRKRPLTGRIPRPRKPVE